MIDTKALYMDPIYGHVQSGEDWIADSIDWYGDIPAQLATLIEVKMVFSEWIDV